jgi:hypothetical protein
MSGLCFLDRCQVSLRRVVDAQVEDLEAGALHHHRHQVLADVVDVALDSADHHAADLLRAGLGQHRAQDAHARLHRFGRHQHFRHEEDAVAEVGADDLHACHQPAREHVVRRLAAAQRLAHLGLDLSSQPVVEIFLHQFVQVFQGQFRQDDFFTHDRLSGR